MERWGKIGTTSKTGIAQPQDVKQPMASNGKSRREANRKGETMNRKKVFDWKPGGRRGLVVDVPMVCERLARSRSAARRHQIAF